MKVTDQKDCIKYTRFKKDGFWFRFIGYQNGHDLVKREHDGEIFALSAIQVRKIDAEEVDGEVVTIQKGKYKTIKIL